MDRNDNSTNSLPLFLKDCQHIQTDVTLRNLIPKFQKGVLLRVYWAKKQKVGGGIF